MMGCKVSETKFGVTKSGREVTLYTLKNANGMEASVMDFGAILVRLLVPNRDGVIQDVVLGYDNLEDYEENGCYFGSIIGRNANRVGGASFRIDGVEYHLTDNENGNNLHTDYHHGFHKVMWSAAVDEAANSVKFSYLSPDGENGFPGEAKVSVTYTLGEDNSLKLTYDGVSDKKTVLNMTNHSYFNLGGHDAGTIVDEKMTIFASGFTEVGLGSIPTGRILPVEGTPMDFRKGRRIGDGIDADFGQLALTQGYDHNWALDTAFGKEKLIAIVEDERAGRTMEVFTDLPGVQFYTGNYITPQKGKGGAFYDRRHALCMETQYFPNSVNEPSFRQPIFEAGEPYHTVTTYKFR